MNDMILNLLANDSFTVSDFRAVGLTAENTKLESEEKYKQSQMIQDNKLFHDEEGNFSDAKFHDYYLQATEFYNHLADETYLEDITKNTFYSKDNIFAPNGSPTIDELPRFVVSPNPFLQNNSLTRVGKKGDRTLSISEIAQRQKIYDSEKGEFREESVNDRAAGNNVFKWLGDLFSEPLVIAQWDEDGEHIDPITGQVKKHSKGEYKYNDDGTFYYETLNGRDIYGRQVLNRMNTLTVDGSKANRYDFFDSDDLEQKSFIGNTLKNLALVGSMFLPVVGKPIIAASVATQAVGLLGTLGKMFLGSDNETANNMHAWAKTVNRQSTTEYASQNTWCWENLINMIGDTVGQLAEQRFIFTHVPALLKGTKGIKAAKNDATYKSLVAKEAEKISQKTNKTLVEAINKAKAKNDSNLIEEVLELKAQHSTMSQLKAQAALEKYMESYHNLGSIMSKAYMTGITVQDTYGEAKANGASDMEALALTLGYAAGEAWILNTGLGEWIMPEAQGEKLKYGAIVNALKKEVKEVSEDAVESATKEGRQNIFRKIFNIGKKIATNDYARQSYASGTYSPMQVVLAHAAGEGFEEVSEEVLADISKSAFNVVNWLRGDETRIAGAWENIGDRYGMSLLGGFVGGGISSAATDFSQAKALAKMTNETAIQEIVYMINNDKIDDFLKYVNKADLGNRYLSFATDENGNFKQGTKEDNQDKDIKTALNQQIKIIRDTINAEGAKFSENSLFDALTLKDLRYLQLRDTATLGAMFQEYNSLVAQIYKKTEEIRQLTGEYTDTDTKKKELTPEQAGEVSKKRQELNDLRVQKDAIISGKRAPEFIATALYEAQKALHGHKRGYIFQEWVEAKTGKKYEDIADTDLKALKEEYKAYASTEMKNHVIDDARQFVHLVGLSSGAIQEQQEYVKRMLEEGKKDALKVQTYLGNLFNGFNVLAQADETFDADAFIQKVQETVNNSSVQTTMDLVAPLFTQDIIDRLRIIDTQPEDEVYTKKHKDLDKLSTVFEAFAEYSDTITQSFIDKGYIHSEVKKHLIDTYQQMIGILDQMKSLEESSAETNLELLRRLSPYFGMDETTFEDAALDDSRSVLLKGYKANLEAKIEQLEELRHTPIIELLEKFKTATADSDLSVRDVLVAVDDLISQNKNDLSALHYGKDLGEQLQEVDEIVDVLASALYATRVDKAGINNSWGYSKTLNELNKKYGNDQWVELAEIEGETADLLLDDLALIKQKLHFARNIHQVNAGQKLTRQNKVGYNKQYIFANKLKRILDQVPPELTQWNFDSIRKAFSTDLLLLKYNSPTHKDRHFSLTPEEKIQIERESLILDDAIYQFFQDNASKLNNVDELVKFFDACQFDLYDPATGLLHDETDDLDDRQFIFTLAAKAALKGSDFFRAYSKTFNGVIAPVPIQEQATYLNVAMVMNGDAMNNFAKAYALHLSNHFKNLSEDKRQAKLAKLEGEGSGAYKFYLENPDLFESHHAVEKFANIILTEGIAGSGKTGGVFDSTVRVIKELKPDLLDKVFVVNSTLANAEKLKKDLDLTGTTFSTSHSEIKHDLIRYFYSDYTSDYKDKVRIVNGKVVTDFTLKEDLKDLPKIIFLDEASRYDYVQMKLLSEAAQHYGIIILAAGDFDQISAGSSITFTKDGQEKRVNLSPNRLNFIGSSKLGVSFRTLNDQMNENQKELLAGLHDSKKTHFNIHYWEDESEIRGFKNYASSEFESIVASIEKIKKNLQDDEKIGFLYVDEASSIYKKVKDKYGDLIDGKSIEDAQGLEGNYYIIDLNRSDALDKQEVRQQLYTGITRAKKGGLIISDGKANQQIYVKNIKDEMSEPEVITPEAIAKASAKRKEIFDILFKDMPETPVEYHEITKVERAKPAVPVKSDDADADGLAPSVEPSTRPSAPPGTYNTREEAEKVDLSIYAEGLELYDKDDTLIGTIKNAEIVEHKDADNTYYEPVVMIETADGTIKPLGLDVLKNHTLKDPTSTALVPQYKVGDMFYDASGESFKITAVNVGDQVQYTLANSKGHSTVVVETDLQSYSLTPPPVKVIDTSSDLGENDDPEVYRQRITQTNSSTLSQDIEKEGAIKHWIYTFNSYETGVLWDADGKIIADYLDPSTVTGQIAKKRIDDVNGLIRLGVVDGPNTTRAECLSILAKVHRALMYNTDNASLLRELESSEILKLAPNRLATVEFGIKSHSPYAFNMQSEERYVYAKDFAAEKVEYAQEGVLKADEVLKRSVVAVFRDDSGEKLLEVTVGTINSPITIGLRTDSEGKYLFPKAAEILQELQPGLTPQEVFGILYRTLKAVEGVPGYEDYHQLLKSSLLGRNAFVPLRNADGTPFNFASQKKSGPNLIISKGEYQKDGTRQYSGQYKDLSELARDERLVVSDVWIPKWDEYGGIRYPIHKGYAGVFVSYNTQYDKNSLPNIYMTQQDPSYKGVKDVEFYYVIPPEATVAEYLKNYRNVYLNQAEGQSLATYFIGNKWTSYKLLHNIHKAGKLVDAEGNPTLKSSLLDKYEFKDILKIIERLSELETKNWEGDEQYKRLFTKYKDAGYSERAAKTYALRNVILEAQGEILDGTLTDALGDVESVEVGTPVYKILTNYIANAVYWRSTSQTPNKKALELVEKYNPGTIKYKVKYHSDSSTAVGLFYRADVPLGSYTLPTLTSSGDTVEKGFTVNSKIDPPIFEIPAVNEALRIMSDWRWEDTSNPDEGKHLGASLIGTTKGYERNSRRTAKPVNNFDILKNNNKILFEDPAYFKNIQIKGQDDLDLDQVHFAEEVLKQFNSEPNNLGFAIVDARGKVKMYAFKINELSDSIARPETETYEGLGGITIGQALVFKSKTDTFTVKTANREYQIGLDGNFLSLTPTSIPSTDVDPLIKVEVQQTALSKEDFDTAMHELNTSDDVATQGVFADITYDNFESEFANDPTYQIFGDQFAEANPAFKVLMDYINNGASTSINIRVGDTVVIPSSDSSQASIQGTVVNIDGTNVTIQVNSSPETLEIYDITKTDIFKKKEQTFECVTPIKIAYGA